MAGAIHVAYQLLIVHQGPLHRLVEQHIPLEIVQHLLVGWHASLEGKAPQYVAAHAVHGTNQRLFHLVGHIQFAGRDEGSAHPLLEFARRQFSKSGGNHAGGFYLTGGQQFFQLLGEGESLAAAGTGADEMNVGAHAPSPQPVRTR